MAALDLTNSRAFDQDPMENSKSLVELARLGDDEAFRLIFEQHHRAVLRFIYGMIGNLALAEELTQETFLSAYHAFSLYREEGKLTPWLCGIAKNVTRNWTRSKRAEILSITVSEQDIRDVEDSYNPSPDKVLLDIELNDKLRNALQHLDDDKRMVFVLKTMRQLSYEEISQITGASISKLKTDLHRARTDLRRLMRPYLEG